MPRFLILILEDERAQERMAPAEMRRLVEDRSAYLAQLRAGGAHLDAERLRPSAEGRRVRAAGGGIEVVPGPFAGEERALGGYYLLEAGDLEAAVALTAACPLAPGDTLEVRPLQKGVVHADKGGARGKTFAFGVLGSARSEAAWKQVMDRIDAETSAGFPPERFAGGVRLEPPGKGHQLAWRGGRRALMDGPFLESKEVIGGLFFLRCLDLDEAVEWAAASPFVVHGALEVRELWRS